MIETVMTYDEWELVYAKRQERKRNKFKRMLKQKCIGLCAIMIGFVTPIVIQDLSASGMMILIGMYLIVEKKIII